MRQTYSTAFYCRQGKAKDGKAPIELVLTINGDRKVLTLPMKCAPGDFVKLRMSPRKNEINTYLASVVSDIDELHRAYPAYSSGRLLDLYKKGVKGSGVVEVQVKMLSEKYLREVIGTRPSYCRYKATFDKFNAMYGNWLASEIRGSEIKRYIEDLREKGYKDSTLFNEYRRLKSLFTFGFELRVVQNHPFATLKMSFDPPANQVYLTLEELDRFYAVELKEAYLQRSRDVFCFLAGCGLELADARTLRPDSVLEKDGVKYVRGFRKKTGVEYLAVLVGYAPEIWNKYQGRLPLISGQKFNDYIRKVAERAGIEKHLTSLSARHTYATLLLSGAYGKMVPLEIVQRTLGHARYAQTAVYAKLLDQSVFDAFK